METSRFRYVRPLFSVIFLCGFIAGASTSWILLARHYRIERNELSDRAVQAYRDLREARGAQRDAQERAVRLQEELGRLADYAGTIEARAKRAEDRAVSLGELVRNAQDECGEVQAGIGRAQDSIDESGELIAELGDLVRGLQTKSGTGDSKP